MRDGDEDRVSRHEAGHALASFLFGRSIEYVVVNADRHETKNVPDDQNRIPLHLEAVILACGWAAEKRYFAQRGLTADEIATREASGGHHDDMAKIKSFENMGLVDYDNALRQADLLVATHWRTLESVAQALLDEKRMDQSRLEVLCVAHDVTFGQGCT